MTRVWFGGQERTQLSSFSANQGWKVMNDRYQFFSEFCLPHMRSAAWGRVQVEQWHSCFDVSRAAPGYRRRLPVQCRFPRWQPPRQSDGAIAAADSRGNVTHKHCSASPRERWLDTLWSERNTDQIRMRSVRRSTEVDRFDGRRCDPVQEPVS